MKEKYLKLLKNSGAKTTSQRVDLLDHLLMNSEKHYTPVELHGELNDEKIGIATIYRTLDLFVCTGIMNKLHLKDGVARYELNNLDGGHYHHHVKCNVCGNLSEIKEDVLGEIEKDIEEKFGFAVQNHDVVFYGICKNCQ